MLSLAALAGMFALAYVAIDARGRVVRRAPVTWSGDEVHYLMIVHSLLLDGDVEMQDDYRPSLARGGKRFRGSRIDHHTVFFDPATREHGLWVDVFDPFTHVRCRRIDPSCTGYARKSDRFSGPGVIEIPAHPLGFPALAAAFVAATGAAPEEIEPRVVWFTILCGWAGAVVTYLVARDAGLRRRGALAAAALLLVCSPWLLYARSYFSEVPAGLALVVALWLLRRGHALLAATAVVVAMTMKPPWVLVGAGWIVERLLAGERKQAFRLAAVLLAGGLAIMALNVHLAGTPVISGQTGWVSISSPRQLLATLGDWEQGLLPFVPWVVPAALALLSGQRHPITRPIALAIVPNLAVFMTFHSLGGVGYGGRYWVPLLPFLAVWTVVLLARAPAWLRVACAVLALAAAAVTLSGMFSFTEVWNHPPPRGPSLFLERVLAVTP